VSQDTFQTLYGIILTNNMSVIPFFYNYTLMGLSYTLHTKNISQSTGYQVLPTLNEVYISTKRGNIEGYVFNISYDSQDNIIDVALQLSMNLTGIPHTFFNVEGPLLVIGCTTCSGGDGNITVFNLQEENLVYQLSGDSNMQIGQVVFTQSFSSNLTYLLYSGVDIFGNVRMNQVTILSSGDNETEESLPYLLQIPNLDTVAFSSMGQILVWADLALNDQTIYYYQYCNNQQYYDGTQCNSCGDE
jgi:WD40 repeat protein